jgi:hypothetical protein
LGHADEDRGETRQLQVRKVSMTAKFDSRDWNAALTQLKVNGSATATAPNVVERDEFKVKVIEARVKLKLMRDRTDALKAALERFRSQRDAKSA